MLNIDLSEFIYSLSMALAEDRPYRSGYGKKDICLALKKNVAEKALDSNLVDIVIKDFDAFYKNMDGK